VQFHPESIMTMKSEVGLALMRNVLERLALPAPEAQVKP
jgi:anthranilate/para-aminobenzoate synthase component II